jgi:hypothetical protein
MRTRRFSINRPGTNTGKPIFSTISDAELNTLLKLIETERDNLSRADSLLGCLKIALEYGDTTHEGPYYPDVAEIARRMVRKSISSLDPINLPNPSRNKVREEFSGKDCIVSADPVREIPLLASPACAAISWPRSLRTHYRKYSRSSARNASSRDSASVNILG